LSLGSETVSLTLYLVTAYYLARIHGEEALALKTCVEEGDTFLPATEQILGNDGRTNAYRRGERLRIGG
jgi:hypothetical protein